MRIRFGPKRILEISCRVGCHCAVLLQASVQAAGVIVPTAPSGFSMLPGAPAPDTGSTAGSGEKIFDGFTLSTSLSGTYDSNVARSPGPPAAPIEDDFILTLGGRVDYLSKSSEWTFGGGYRGSYNEYFNQSEYSGYNQGAGVLANYEGGKVSASITAGVSLDRGSNQNYSSAFVTQTSFTTNLTARYRISPKTSLQGDMSQNYTTADESDYSDTQNFAIGGSALWKYSPLTELGPGLRYTHVSGSSQTGRNSIGPTLTVNYKLSSKVALNSRVGMDFASYEDGGTADPSMSAAIGLNYDASKLWGMNFSLYRDTQADPSLAGAFTEVTSLRLGYRRKVRRATLNLGIGYDANRSQRPADGAGGGGDDRDFFTTDGSLGMAVLSNTSFASVFFRYGDQSASDTDTWRSFQTGFGISRSF
ncbi:MAG: outer membrane beta-barrel protein [Verrucomicrobiota bacterium]